MTDKQIIQKLIGALEVMTFVSETVAHLNHLERDLLPHCDDARKAIDEAKSHINSDWGISQ